ncbi:MAG: hypothetical protein RLZZ436_3095 [Planctomycetota bacterium]|jgi:hypothetical protein
MAKAAVVAVVDDLQQRRRRVGLVTLVCGVTAAAGFIFATPDAVWPAAAMRIGIVFGSLWLCFPDGRRRAAWSVLTPGRLFLVAIAAWYASRLKYALPALGVLLVLLRFLRPPANRGGRRGR